MDRVATLEQQLQVYLGEQANLLANITAAVQHAVQASQASHVPLQPSHDRGAPDAQLAALSTLADARGYVLLLKDCADAVREVERHVYGAAALAPEDDEGLVRLAAEGAELYGGALRQLAALSERGDGGGDNAGGGGSAPAALRGCELELGQRLQACSGRLREALGARIDAHLAECGWPPQIVGAPPPRGPPDGPGAGGAASGGGDGLLFASADRAASVAALQRLMLGLTRLQRVEERAAFEALDESGLPLAAMAGDAAPLLWLAQRLAAPLAGGLRQLFANAAPAGHLDRPDLLLGTVLRLARDLGPSLDFLQSVLEASDLHGQYHVGPEFGRALREAAKQLLRDEKLPALAAAADRDLWLTWVDSLIDFEVKMAAPLGVSSELAVRRGDVPLPLLRQSALSVLGERPEWMDAWLSAEAGAAHKALQGILYSPTSWERAPSLAAEEWPAWRCEFYPPAAAEALVALLAGQLMPRVHYIPQPEAQDRYLQMLVLDILGGAHASVVRMLQQADLFRDVRGIQLWAGRVAVCISFCHFLEHHIGELTATLTELLKSRTDPAELAALAATPADGGPAPGGGGAGFPSPLKQQRLLFATPPDAAAAAGAAAPGSAGAPAFGQQGSAQQQRPQQPGAFAPGSAQQQQQQPSPGWPSASPSRPGTGATPSRPGTGATPSSATGAFGTPVPSSASSSINAASLAARRLMARPRADFAAARREWTLNVAKAVAQGFLQGAQGYLSSGAAFKDGDAAGAEAGVVSAGMVDALRWLQGALHVLSQQLDRDCFRDCLRATAAALNRELFNNVATEMVFSPAGARQLAVDVSALMRLFQPYAWRAPTGYFLEMVDALRLLNLRDQGQLDVVKTAVSPETRAPNAGDVLRSVGVRALDADQADAVLSLRLQ
ncbi:MAG: TIP-1 family-domain-containing protein [Monoraphidium minutum]|nr:MAG: TIP-1 family-domain-containing protein [Monoraphidium minutum]